MQSKVSMVVPCYNKEEYIGEMLESVYNQIWDNIELILVNDGSTDGTRHIISQWEPKLRERGYDVVIIDQENQGLSAAVRNGMLRMSGEYFCTVDCDDLLHPEYVSAMAGWLDENPEYQWVNCKYYLHNTGSGKQQSARTVNGHSLEDTRELLKRFLIGHMGAMITTYMVSGQYLADCRIIERFSTQERVTQEPMLLIPLCYYGGRIKHIDRALYLYRKESSGTGRSASMEEVRSFCKLFDVAIEKTILSLDAAKEEKEYMLRLASFLHKGCLLLFARKFAAHREDIVTQTVNITNEILTPCPQLKPKSLAPERIEVFIQAMHNALLGITPIPAQPPSGRVIGYGALGEVAQKCLPLLADTPWQSDILWDISAKPDSQYVNQPVEKPDFASLRPDDTLLVFPKSQQIFQQVLSETQTHPVKNIYGCQEIRDIASCIYYPELLQCRPKNLPDKW